MNEQSFVFCFKENSGVRAFRRERRRSAKKHFHLRGYATEVSFVHRKNINFFGYDVFPWSFPCALMR